MLFDLLTSLEYITNVMDKEYNVDFIWQSLSDFWTLFEDRETISQLWRGYVFSIQNLFFQAKQLDLSKSVFTIPYNWISDWELFIFDRETELKEGDKGFDLFPDFPYKYKLPHGVKNVSRLAESPREVIELPRGTKQSPDGIIILPDGTRRYAGDVIHIPEDEDTIKHEETPEGTYTIYTAGVSVDTFKLLYGTDYTVDTETLTIHLNKKPYSMMWSNVAIRDLSMIYDNFGSLIYYHKPDSFEYLREIQGLWYSYWSGSTLSSISSGLNILRDLPFAETEGLVTDITYIPQSITINETVCELNEDTFSKVSVGDTVTSKNNTDGVVVLNNTVILRIGSELTEKINVDDKVTAKTEGKTRIIIDGRTYEYEEISKLNVSVGDYVFKFQPLTAAIKVHDYISNPGWWDSRNSANNFNICGEQGGAEFDDDHFDGEHTRLDSYTTNACLRYTLLKYFTFAVEVDLNAWCKNKEELLTCLAFIQAMKPAYTKFIMQFQMLFTDEVYVYDDETAFKMEWEEHLLDNPGVRRVFDDEGWDFDSDNTLDTQDEWESLQIDEYPKASADFVDSCSMGNYIGDLTSYFDGKGKFGEYDIEKLELTEKNKITNLEVEYNYTN